MIEFDYIKSTELKKIAVEQYLKILRHMLMRLILIFICSSILFVTLFYITLNINTVVLQFISLCLTIASFLSFLMSSLCLIIYLLGYMPELVELLKYQKQLNQ